MGTFDGLPKAARVEILTRVPTQTVLDCKLVSKSWRKIVRDPSFGRKHLKHLSDSDSGKFMGLLLFHKTPGLEEYTEYDDESSAPVTEPISKPRRSKSSSHGKARRSNSSSHVTPPFSKARRFNIISPFEHYEILDSCNGLICFTALRSRYYPFAAGMLLADRLAYYGPSFICNPITREIVVLPEFEGEDLLAGFGYCSLTNEYKVVGIRSCKKEANYGDVQVYTLGSGKGWRNAGKMEYQMEGDIRKVVRRGVLANDALHWVDAGGTLLTFDLASEKLSVISSPPMNEPGEFYHLVVLGDYLYAIYMHNKKGVWLLKQTNANRGRPWKKEFSLGLRSPFASTKSGRFLCLGQVSGSVYRNDPKTSSSELLESFSRSVCIIIPHRNTLISLKELGEENTQSMESVERERSSEEMQTAFVRLVINAADMV